MPQTVDIPGKGTAEFPDDWTPAQIQDSIWKSFPEFKPKTEPSLAPQTAAAATSTAATKSFPLAPFIGTGEFGGGDIPKELGGFQPLRLPRVGFEPKPDDAEPVGKIFGIPETITATMTKGTARKAGAIAANAVASGVEGMTHPLTPVIIAAATVQPEVVLPLLTASMGKSGAIKLGEGLVDLQQGRYNEAVRKIGEAGTELTFAGLPALKPSAFTAEAKALAPATTAAVEKILEPTPPTQSALSPTVESLRRELEHLQGGEITDATKARAEQIVGELGALEPKPPAEAPASESPKPPEPVTPVEPTTSTPTLVAEPKTAEQQLSSPEQKPPEVTPTERPVAAVEQILSGGPGKPPPPAPPVETAAEPPTPEPRPQRIPLPSEPQKKIEVGEMTALRTVFGAAQKAGEAGVKAGRAETLAKTRPIIAELRDKLSDSISKAEALTVYLKGQEKGSAIGAEFAAEDAQRIDRWLAADTEHIRTSLLQLAGELPVGERGRFLSAITMALRRPPLYKETAKVGGEQMSAVQAMYQRAATVASRIDNRIGELEIEALHDDIRGFKKWGESQKIDVPQRQGIREELKRFELLKGDLPKDALIAIRDRLVSLRDIGRTTQATKEAVWEWQKEFASRRLAAQETRPIETRPEFRPPPGEPMTLSMRIGNWLRAAQNRASRTDKALLPIDALFDLMEDAKGTYQGWLFRHARGPVDLGFNEYLVRRNAILEPVERFIREHGLTAQSGERIGVYANNLQEGGRARMVEAGLPEAEIDRLVNSLTPGELAAYRMMRKIMDNELPAIQDTMRRLYNTEVTPEENYFPMRRDWRVFEEKPAKAAETGTEVGFDQLATWRALLEDFTPRATSQTRKGFTLERQKGALSPVRIDAFDVFRQHINDVVYLEEMQPIIKQLGELGRSDLFREKYGDVGQKMFLDWMDTIARQGGVQSFKRWKMLDTIRKNTSVGIIGFRLSSQIVHESNVPYIYARIGNWFGTGMREAFTARGQEFIKRHFGETLERSGSEPAQAESEKEGVKIAGVRVIPQPVVKASYAIARQLDRFNSQASALGAYIKELSDKGLDPQAYDQLPLDVDAHNHALVLARRSIASPLPKDVPQALSRGTLTGGNVSLGRSLFQFQNIFLDQWSNIRHDLFQAGIMERNPKLAGTMLLAILGAIALESGIKVGVKKGIQTVTGSEPKKQQDELGHKIVQETVRRFPFGGQIENQMLYGESGVPSLDAIIGISKSARTLATAKKRVTQERAMVRTAAGVGQLLGIPGSSQIGELIEKEIK